MGMIIIKNYSMPHNCYACDLHNYHECNLTSESIEDDYCWNGDSREKHCPLREVEAISKADHENRLKADMVAMLRFLWNDIENLDAPICDYASSDCISKWQVHEVIQQKINSIKAEIEPQKSEG